jgi:hypothetical protein
MKQWIIFCVACFVILKCTEEIEEISEDITPPIVNITYPHDGQIIHCCQDTIDIKVEATDNIGIERINFTIIKSNGGAPIVTWTDYAEPYIYEKWTPPHHYDPTNYDIEVEAYDSSQNRKMDDITIIIEH